MPNKKVHHKVAQKAMALGIQQPMDSFSGKGKEMKEYLT